MQYMALDISVVMNLSLGNYNVVANILRKNNIRKECL
jgi:hypothetical protein